jgi:hypothetical protein
VVVPFRYSVPKEAQDFSLLEKLERERSAIIGDALDFYWQLQQRHYRFSGDYELNEMFYETCALPQSDGAAVASFLLAHCVFGAEESVFVDDLFQKFCEAHPGAGIQYTQFTEKIRQACDDLGISGLEKLKKRKTSNGNPLAFLRGIGLR